MDLSRGCVLIARSLDESDIFQNEKWLKVWVWCVIQANHKGKNVPVNIGRSKTSIWVNRGQFIFGRNKAGEKLGMSPSTVRNIMDKLDDLGNLDIKPDKHFSVVTLSDFDFYQDMKNYLGQTKGQPEDNQRTTRGQPEDTTNTPKQPNTPKQIKYTVEFEKLFKDYPNTDGSKSQTFKNYKSSKKKHNLSNDQIEKAAMNSYHKQRDSGKTFYFQLSNVLGQKYSDDLLELLKYIPKTKTDDNYHVESDADRKIRESKEDKDFLLMSAKERVNFTARGNLLSALKQLESVLPPEDMGKLNERLLEVAGNNNNLETCSLISSQIINEYYE